jgi:hypothetical protein
LIEIERPSDFDGWYNRKGYPSFNILAIVDHQKKFMFVSIKPGSNNDQSVFNTSFRNVAEDILPANCYLLADAGYALMTYMMTPYPIRPGMDREEARYNYYHSKSRMVVEMAFGLLKMKFGILRTPLNMKSKESMAKIILASMIIHNWLIDLKEPEETLTAPLLIDDIETDRNNVDAVARDLRDSLKIYLNEINDD